MADKLIIKWKKVVQMKTIIKEQPSVNQADKERETEIKKEGKEKENDKIPPQNHKADKKAAGPSIGIIRY